MKVTSAKYIANYTIYVTFSDGKVGTVNLSDTLWGPMFEPLKDPEAFKDFSISPIFDTICWKNGADIAPEYLHERVEE